MPEFAWVELDWDTRYELIRQFEEDFAVSWDEPGYVEPAPSLTYRLPEIESRQPFAQLVNDVLRACVEDWDSVFHHIELHWPGQYRPHRVDDITELKDWERSHYPDRHHLLSFVGRDHGFGVFAQHWNRTACFFGAAAVDAVQRLNRGVLTELVRVNGVPGGAPRAGRGDARAAAGPA